MGVKCVEPYVGICFATHHTDVLLGSEIVVLLGVWTSRRLKEQPDNKRIFTLEHCDTNDESAKVQGDTWVS